MTKIQNTRMNKRFIYSLVGSAKRNGDDDYCNDKFEMWEECEFVSSRNFDNLFFEEKDQLVSKLKFFVDNKDWYSLSVFHLWRTSLITLSRVSVILERYLHLVIILYRF